MRLGEHIIRFEMGPIPVVGNTVTGAIVGLTPSGAQLCDLMLTQEVSAEDVPAECEELVAYLGAHGFFDDGTAAHRPAIQSAYLHVTNRCNLDCVGCYSRDAARNVAADPSLGELERAAVLLAELGVERLVISGGEPFVRTDLGRVAAAAKSRGIHEVVVLTNGILCNPDRLSALAGSVDIISVSFDGASPSAPSYVRGPQLFNQLTAAIENIKSAGIHPHILPTIHARNVDDVADYLAIGKKLGATVGFSLLSGSRAELGELYPTDACLARLADIMFAYNARSGDDAVAQAKGAGLSARVSCGAGKTGVSVAADGSVYPCHMLHYPAFRLGNAYRDTQEELGEALERFSMPTVDETDGCRSCDKRYLCGGGCRARTFIEYGRIDREDPYCLYYGRSINSTISSLSMKQ